MKKAVAGGLGGAGVQVVKADVLDPRFDEVFLPKTLNVRHVLHTVPSLPVQQRAVT